MQSSVAWNRPGGRVPTDLFENNSDTSRLTRPMFSGRSRSFGAVAAVAPTVVLVLILPGLGRGVDAPLRAVGGLLGLTVLVPKMLAASALRLAAGGRLGALGRVAAPPPGRTGEARGDAADALDEDVGRSTLHRHLGVDRAQGLLDVGCRLPTAVRVGLRERLDRLERSELDLLDKGITHAQ